MTTLAAIAKMAGDHHLGIFGAFHLEPGDDLPPDLKTLVLFGPEEPGFWAHVTAEPEWLDAAPDPLDRWSRRTLGTMACDLGGKAYFPFGGQPYHPFYQWALRSGRAWASPVTLLVHEQAGLFVSYRGAIAVKGRLELPPADTKSPCEICEAKPCLTGCPPRAMTDSGYNVPACHDFLDTQDGDDCLSFGCGVRRACPVSQAYGRLPEQSSYHMRLFHT